MTILALQASPTAVSNDLALRRTLLEQQWTQQLADLTDLSYEALAPIDEDVDDGSEANGRHVTRQLLAAARQQLADTEAALGRLDDGSYGLCGDCSNPINAERLEILPAARYCIACQATRSRRR